MKKITITLVSMILIMILVGCTTPDKGDVNTDSNNDLIQIINTAKSDLNLHAQNASNSCSLNYKTQISNALELGYSKISSSESQKTVTAQLKIAKLRIDIIMVDQNCDNDITTKTQEISNQINSKSVIANTLQNDMYLYSYSQYSSEISEYNIFFQNAYICKIQEIRNAEQRYGRPVPSSILKRIETNYQNKIGPAGAKHDELVRLWENRTAYETISTEISSLNSQRDIIILNTHNAYDKQKTTITDKINKLLLDI